MRGKKQLIIIIAMIMILMIGVCISASESRGSKSLNLYYTGTSSGSHEYESFTPNAAPVYYFKRTSSSGSFQYLSIYVNHVKIGDLPSAALASSGCPVYYDVSNGNPFIEVSMIHGSGAASFSGQVNY